jgi:NAD-dependent dihydropyrimidine dehydrogenase PreA subunit
MIKDEDMCIRCGLCAMRCPVGCITMEGYFVSETMFVE